MKVGVINASSYFGLELVRLLAGHPELEVAALTARSQAGKAFGEVFPHMAGLYCGSRVAALKLTEEIEDAVDIVFSCLPHAASATALLPFIKRGIPVIDVSADFRLKDAAEYAKWYGVAHPAPELLAGAVYGLTEIHRQEIRTARIVGNPGCYPTAAVLALAPALREGLVENVAIVDAKSGVSGGGRSLTLANHYSEVNESVHAYATAGHRHGPEITQELSGIAGAAVRVTFVPHLVPMTRGILATCYAPLRRETTGEELAELYRDAYASEPFVIVATEPPHTKWTYASNYCAVHATVDHTGTQLLATAALDNLVKGAAGEALQNANVMLGFEETAGLTAPPIFP